MKKVGDMNQGGGAKSVLEDGFYKLVIKTVKVVLGKTSGFAFAVLGLSVVSEKGAGQTTELGFSFSPNAEGICYAWLVALGFKDTDEIETEDPDLLEKQLRGKIIGLFVEGNIVKKKNSSGYDANEISPPWEIARASEITEAEANAVSLAPAPGVDTKQEELPDWAK